VHVASFRQWSYKNLQVATLEYGEGGVSAFVGPNAAGKTNLLDAHYLAVTGTLTGGRLRDVIHWEQNEAFVASACHTQDGRHDLRVALSPSRKTLSLDGQTAKPADVHAAMTAVRMSPEDADMVHGSPSGRRAWLDDVLTRVSPRYGAILREYERVLEQRNAGLKRSIDGTLLGVLSDRLATLGGELEEVRARAVDRMSQLASEAYAAVSGGGKALRIELRLTRGDTPLPRALNDHWHDERRRGATLFGPHRDDVAILLDERSVQTFGSRGEARTASLALRSAELTLLRDKHGGWPVILLDDFSAELDSERRAFLMALIAEADQAIVTGTEAPPGVTDVREVQGGEVTHAD
jgi:DNA replication and repair protein RecF